MAATKTPSVTSQNHQSAIVYRALTALRSTCKFGAKLRLLAILSALLIGLAPASVLPASAAAAKNPYEWIFVGDSITRVTMVSGKPTSFSTLVGKALGKTVTEYNAGAIGMTTSRGLNQVKNAMRQHPSAMYVAINLGTNDTDAYLDANGKTVCEVTTTGFYSDYAAVVRAVIADGRIPVVPTMPSARNEYCGTLLNGEITRLYTDPEFVAYIVPGPDLWTHFWVGPCGDGTVTHDCRTGQQAAWFPDIHPSTDGAVEYRTFWADEMLVRAYNRAPTR